MKHYDWSNPDDRRLAYRESMLGLNRPQNASKKSTSAVDGLIEAVTNDVGTGRPHFAAVAKARRKALLRMIGRMEYDSEETALMEEIIQHAVENCTPNDGNAQVRMDNLLHELRTVREKIANRKGE